MKFLKFSLIAVAVTAIALTGSLASANLLTNAGFEDPITFDGPPFVGFWEGFNNGGLNTSDATTTMPRTDLQSLELNLGDANGFAGAFQDVPNLVAGTPATFSGWHKSLLEPGGIEIRIEWFDSDGNGFGSTPNLTPMPGSTYEMFSLTADVPAGADTARATYAIQSFGAQPGQQVFVDDTSFEGTQIPEPASIALMGLAGLALASMRRRK